jgi:anion-transporting  ArsA/GET3 family ATPase
MFAGMQDVLDRRLVFVTGKGGVGKSTVATALGLLAARAGRRTIVAELSGQERVQRAFDREVEPFAEAELAPGLFTISVEPQHAMEEYLHLRVGALGGVLASSRLFGAFAMATPGMRELLSIGKVWELAQFERRTRGADPYDLVIVDAPATGHGVGILRTPRTFAEIARVGPIAHQGSTIARTIADPAFTAIVAVTSAEEMPVNETLSAAQAIADEGLALSGVIVNAVLPTRFTAAETARLELPSAAGNGRGRAAVNAAVRAALSEHARAASQQIQLARLREALPDPQIVELPHLFVPEIELPEL